MIVVLFVLLVAVLMIWAALYLLGRRPAEPAAAPTGSHKVPATDELDLPAPEAPVMPPPTPLDRGGLGGAFFDSSWEDDEAATEVAVMPPTPAPVPRTQAPPQGLTPMQLPGELMDADEQATEVLDANANAELAAAVRKAQAEEIPSFGDAGAYFDDDWDEEEAPTAVMTRDMADEYAKMLLDEDDDDDEPQGPGRVVAKKN